MKKQIIFINTSVAKLSYFNPIKSYLDDLYGKDQWINFDSNIDVLLDEDFINTIRLGNNKETYTVYVSGIAAQQMAMIKNSDKKVFINPCIGGIMQSPDHWTEVFTNDKWLGGYNKVIAEVPYEVYTASETKEPISEEEYLSLNDNIKDYFEKIEAIVPKGTLIH